MNKKILLMILSILIILLFFTVSVGFLNRSILENDEGIYWSTFMLADKGYPLYSETSFSQLPGFFIATFSIFKFLGATIFSARLSVLYWIILALLSLVWLGYIRRNLLFSLLVVISLIGIPVFFNQSITFQSDAVAVAFSALSFVLMTAFVNSGNGKKEQNLVYLIFSSIFFSLTLLTKFDYSLVLPFVFLLFSEKKISVRNSAVFVVISGLLIVTTLSFFGLNNIIESVLTLRQKASQAYQFDPIRLFSLLKSETYLSLIIIANIICSIFKWKKDRFSVSLFLWFLGSLILVFSFRPVFQHHLVFLAIPSVLLFSNYLTGEKSRIYRYSVFLLIGFSAFNFLKNYNQVKLRQKIVTPQDRETAIIFIKTFAGEDDFIITDEAALYMETGKLPPPELVDLSEVQIKSGNVSLKKFREAVDLHNPKVVILWNGRLRRLKNVEEVLVNYRKLDLGNNRIIYY